MNGLRTFIASKNNKTSTKQIPYPLTARFHKEKPLIIVVILSTFAILFAFLFGGLVPLLIHRIINKCKQNPQAIIPQDIEELKAIPTYRYFVITLTLTCAAILPLAIHSPDEWLTCVLMFVFTLSPLMSGLYFSVLDEKISDLETLYEENTKNSERGNVNQSSPTVHGWIKDLYNAE